MAFEMQIDQHSGNEGKSGNRKLHSKENFVVLIGNAGPKKQHCRHNIHEGTYDPHFPFHGITLSVSVINIRPP